MIVPLLVMSMSDPWAVYLLPIVFHLQNLQLMLPLMTLRVQRLRAKITFPKKRSNPCPERAKSQRNHQLLQKEGIVEMLKCLNHIPGNRPDLAHLLAAEKATSHRSILRTILARMTCNENQKGIALEIMFVVLLDREVAIWTRGRIDGRLHMIANLAILPAITTPTIITIALGNRAIDMDKDPQDQVITNTQIDVSLVARGLSLNSDTMRMTETGGMTIRPILKMTADPRTASYHDNLSTGHGVTKTIIIALTMIDAQKTSRWVVHTREHNNP
jgi:hypothetical protein